MNDDNESLWVAMDEVEAEFGRPSSNELRRMFMNQIPDPIEGRIVGPGEPSPGRNQMPRTPDPEGKRLMMMPMKGRPIPGGTYAAFVLDGPAAGQWKVAQNHWRAVQMDTSRSIWSQDPHSRYQDETISTKTTIYELQRLAISSEGRRLIDEPGQRRQYWFWSSVPAHEMDPAAAVFLLIEAEPWQAQMCRVPERY
jgi:hypothetical protein